MKIFFPGILMLFLCFTSEAQVFLDGGANYNIPSAKYVLGNVRPTLTGRFGLKASWPLGHKFAVSFGMRYANKAYGQQIAGESYRFNLNYLSFPLSLGFHPTKAFTVEAGLSANSLLGAKMVTADDRYGVLKNYRQGDFCLLAGLSYKTSPLLAFYLQYQYSLTPAIQYDRIDQWGNFIGKTKDLRLQTVSVGMTFRIVNFGNQSK